MSDEFDEVPPGVLCENGIRTGVKVRNLITDPSEGSFQPSSYDLRIGTVFFDGRMIGKDSPNANDSVILLPGDVVSITTLEEVRLPKEVMATVFPINAQSRKGLMVLNPGHIDPGFEGFLTVKALNLRKVPLAILRQEKILTIIFEKLRNTTRGYSSNQPRDVRERKILTEDVESSPVDLSQVITSSTRMPFVTREVVKEELHASWLSKIPFCLGIIAVVIAISALALNVLVLYRSMTKVDVTSQPAQAPPVSPPLGAGGVNTPLPPAIPPQPPASVIPSLLPSKTKPPASPAAGKPKTSSTTSVATP